jgi:hypothetical protein
MFWKKRSSLLQEKTIPPPFGKPAWRNPFDDTPIRPPAGGKKPPTFGRRPSGAIRPVPEIRGDNVFGQDYFTVLIKAIDFHLSNIAGVPEAIKVAFRRAFSRFLNPSQATEASVNNQSINDLLRFFNMLKLYAPSDNAFRVKNFRGMMEEVFGVTGDDDRSELLLRYFLFRFGIGPDDVNYPTNWEITFDIQDAWTNFQNIEDIFVDLPTSINLTFDTIDELFEAGTITQSQKDNLERYIDLLRDRAEKVQDALVGVDSGITTALMVVRQQLIDSFNSGDVIGVLQNMVRYQTQLADLIDGLYDSIDHPIFNNLPPEVRVEIMENLRESLDADVSAYFEDSGYANITNPNGPFGNVLSWLFGTILG